MKYNVKREELLKFLREKQGDLTEISLRDIGFALKWDKNGKINPELVSHYIKSLENHGYIRKENSSSKKFKILKQPVDNIVRIPLYGVTAQCGPDGLLAEDSIKEYVPMHSKMFGISNPQDYLLITAKGDSMQPMIHDGDTVLVLIQDDLESGQVGLVVHNDQPKIKKIIKMKNNYSLVSLNSNNYEVETVDEFDSFRIVGKVRSIIRNNIGL